MEIRTMPEDIYNENKNLVGQEVSSTINYYIDTVTYQNGELIHSSEQVTEDEFNNFVPSNSMNQGNIGGGIAGIMGDGYVNQSYSKSIRTSITQLSNGEYRYKLYTNFNVIPSLRSYDIAAIGLEYGKVYANGTKGFYQSYCTSPSSCSSNSNNVTYSNQTNGMGVSFLLQSGSFISLSSTFYYNVSKANGTVYSMSAYGDYAHAISSVTSGQASGYTVGMGIGLPYTISSYYDSIATAEATWSGTW